MFGHLGRKLKKVWQFFNSDYWLVRKYDKLKDQILRLRLNLQILTDQELKNKTKNLKKSYQLNANLEVLLVEAYAVAFEAIFRITGLVLHPVQILGAIVLHFGDVAEMKTGEGKTLTSILPAYLNALTGKTVFIVTVNEYLVNRDFVENGKIFNFLGITVGKTLNQMNREDKLTNYAQAVVYGTHSEFGFDYLRDNMLQLWQVKLQKHHYYVIIDEADSVLIDEGRTPLIISGKPKNRSQLYQRVDNFVKNLKSLDFKIDAETKSCFLQKPGVLKAQQKFGIKNLFDLPHSELFHFVNNALQANYVLKKNIDYLVRDNKILLIDQFTGRVTPDRVLSEGLHQSLEAKELCAIREETSVLATITYQNFFRLFDKISGMTGTAKTEEEELIDLFNMHVLQVPTDQPVIRFDDRDLFFYDKKNKYLTLAKHIQELNQKGQPILVGTCSVQTSEELSRILKKFGLKFSVLNAKHHQYEAQLIASAGKHRVITISTNMAGRGTDIKLDKIAKKVGGLAVLGVERNESRRIDFQLQGRSGRQGEPGYSAFYVSLDDDLFLRFGNSHLKKIFKPLQNEVLKSRILSRTIAKAQKKLQSTGYSQRKNLLKYDNVISQQMRVVYKQRDFLIETDQFDLYLNKLFHNFFQLQWSAFFQQKFEVTRLDVFAFFHYLQKQIDFSSHFLKNLSHDQTFMKEEVISFFAQQTVFLWEQTKINLPQFISSHFANLILKKQPEFNAKNNPFILELKSLLLETIDYFWTTHLDELLHVKASSFLHSYAQKSPLQAFIEDAEELFSFLKKRIIFSAMPKVMKYLNRHSQREV